MAKLQEYRTGKFRFKLKGKYFYLPGLTKRDAESAKEKVEKLASAKAIGSVVPGRVADWLGSCSDEFYGRLFEWGLVEPRAVRQPHNLIEFMDAYIEGRTDVKASTRLLMTKARNSWATRQPAELTVSAVTAADALAFHRTLLADGMAKSTARLTCSKIKQMFEFAVDAEIISRNPFAKVKTTGLGNDDRQEFVPRESIDRVLAKCPDAEFRLLVCLSRYGGLRIPSESDELTWHDIDHEAGEINVRSPKTGTRIMPLFPELVEPLREAFEAAPDGSTHVIVKHRGGVRRQLGRIIDRAELERWPRIFHNMRASRETELTERFPLHVACRWIGNSPQVANRHYLQVTPEHMNAARETAAPLEQVGAVQ